MLHIKLFMFFILLSVIPMFSIDLTYIDLSNKTVNLDGEMEFYWNKLIYPDDTYPGEFKTVAVPFDWSKDDEYEVWGFGTFKTTIKLPENSHGLGLKMFYTLNYYRLYINGELKAENGHVDSVYKYNDNRISTTIVELPETDEIELILQVSNHVDIHGGILAPPKIGSFSKLNSGVLRSIITETFLFGVLFVTGLLYCGFYFNKKDDKSALYFGLFSIILAIRTVLYGEHILLLMLNSFSPGLEATLGHLTYYVAFPLFMKFLSVEYPYKHYKKINGILYIISFLFCFLAIGFEHKVLVQFLFIYQIISIVGAFVAVVVLMSYALKKNKSAIVTVLGFLVLFITTINDILHSQEIISTFFMIPIGMLIFIMSQSVLLSWSIARAYVRSELLSKELTHVNKSFRRFVPEEFLNILNRTQVSDIMLGDHVQVNMTIMFCDIRGFTTLSESMTPRENFMFINSFLERIGPVIRENGGFIDKYMGDGIMSLFPEGADSAVKAALDMQDVLKIYNKHRNNSGYNNIQLGIGINTGSLMLGTIGENQRMDGTVISDAVNICSRIESITKEYGLSIAMSEDTYTQLINKKSVEVRNIGRIFLKGKNKPVSVYELFNDNVDAHIQHKHNTRPEFEKAVELYESKQYIESGTIFSELLHNFPEDSVCQNYIKKISLI